MLKSLLLMVFLVATGVCVGQESTVNRTAADDPFVPEAAMPGGIVMPLYPGTAT